MDLIDDFADNDEFFIVLELCDNTLDKLLPKLNEDDRYLICKELIDAISFLHSKSVCTIHRWIIESVSLTASRDLKPSNILLKKESNRFHVRLADFDIHLTSVITSLIIVRTKKELDSGKTSDITETTRGTLNWRPPEVIQQGQFSYKSDTWMLGAVIFYILTEKVCSLPHKSHHFSILLSLLKEVRRRIL